MADLNYQVGIDTRQASRNLDSLKSQILGFGSAIAGAFAFNEIRNVSSRFEDLRTTLQLLYKDSQLGAAAFEDIKKFAASSIFSVEDLTETIVKLKAAGLEPTVSLLRLFADTSSVAADSVGALQAITDLYARTTAGGLGLEDLNRLADRGIPVFSILSERLGISRLEISKLGQTAEGARIILKALEDGLQDAFGGASEARAGNVSQAVSNLGDAFANASDIIGRAGLNEALSKLIKGFTDLITASTPLLEILGKSLGLALSLLAENLKIVIALSLAFLTTLAVSRIAAISTAVLGLAKSFNLLNILVGKNPLVKLLGLALGVGAAFGVMSLNTEDLSAEIDKLNESGNKLKDNNGFKVLQEGKLGAGTENLKESLKKVNTELNKFRVEMDSVVASFARFNRENIQSINLETELIGKSTELRRVREAELEITNKAAEEIARLRDQKAKLTEEEKKQGRGAVIDETIKKIQQQAEADKAATAEAIRNSEARIAARRLEEFAVQSQVDANKDLRKIQDDIAKSTMTEIQKKQYDILAAARERAEAEIRAEEVRRGSRLTDQERLQFYEAAKRGTEELIKAEQRSYDQSRLFSTGWRQAFNDYVENATNAANTAKNIFQKATQGMEDMIVNFAKTGKFEFKSFVNSILEELLRSQIRQTMAQIFQIPGLSGGGSSTGGSLFGSVGKLLGFANGGIIPTNAPVVVGERGPELLMGASGRQVIPNEQLGASTNVTYNINAVDASSFKALVAADPGFIHAVAMQGAKTVPGRR